jgi:hypothetical protein
MTALIRVCPVARKHTYPDWETGVHYALRRSARTGLPLRVYGCECGGFHLTKRTTWTERKAA